MLPVFLTEVCVVWPDYVQELRKLIEAKSKGKKFVSTAPKETKPTKDLLEALKASIETKKK